MSSASFRPIFEGKVLSFKTINSAKYLFEQADLYERQQDYSLALRCCFKAGQQFKEAKRLGYKGIQFRRGRELTFVSVDDSLSKIKRKIEKFSRIISLSRSERDEMLLKLW